MGRRKYEPTRDGNVNVVSIEERENGVCDNKLFYANRIKTLRSLAHFTQAELASLLGVSRTAVFNWETGRSRPDITNIPALCQALDIPISEFFSDTGNGANWDLEERQLLFTYRNLSQQHQRFMMKMLNELSEMEQQSNARKPIHLLQKLYAEDSVAAGIGTTAFDASCSKAYVHDTPLLRKTDILFHVNGQSMEPKYPDHCTVMVKKESQLAYGDVGIFQVDGTLFIKEYRPEGLHSLNPAYRTMTPDQYTEIKTIGRVIGIMDDDDFASAEEISEFKS